MERCVSLGYFVRRQIGLRCLRWSDRFPCLDSSFDAIAFVAPCLERSYIFGDFCVAEDILSCSFGIKDVFERNDKQKAQEGKTFFRFVFFTHVREGTTLTV